MRNLPDPESDLVVHGGPSASLLAVVLLLAFALAGCSAWCLKSIDLKPSVSALDVKTLAVGNIAVENTIQFKSCCPSKQQQTLALALQQSVSDLYAKLLANDVSLGATLEERRSAYNSLRGDAEQSIYTVILVCEGKGGQTIAAGPHVATLSVPPTADEAWQKVQDVLNKIKSKIGGAT